MLHSQHILNYVMMHCREWAQKSFCLLESTKMFVACFTSFHLSRTRACKKLSRLDNLSLSSQEYTNMPHRKTTTNTYAFWSSSTELHAIYRHPKEGGALSTAFQYLRGETALLVLNQKQPLARSCRAYMHLQWMSLYLRK